ncbi:hypothetical protein [Pandoraea pnomenusa]|uniref:hypothetical protein n=1 Tax=Pandoraea pnomenusa TaxID=93220 RepID=UPI001AC0219E|nr:hypothetical protein [Pandoraea pnomenusa]MBN9093905.1 hypothetical protein [Pandoraea pnomenusa]
MQLPQWNLGTPQNIATLVKALGDAMRPVIRQINELAAGQASAINNKESAPPAVGTTTAYAQGDFIKNSAPVELGASGAKYVVTGWICVAAGTPGTWKECRCLTGA